MSASTSATDFDVETVLTQLRRDRLESEKFVAEQRKLMAEAAKLQRETALFPVGIIVGIITALAASFTAGGAVVVAYFHATGRG